MAKEDAKRQAKMPPALSSGGSPEGIDVSVSASDGQDSRLGSGYIIAAQWSARGGLVLAMTRAAQVASAKEPKRSEPIPAMSCTKKLKR